MKERKIGSLIVNFGGPRNLEEIESFLIALLTDRDVISTSLPPSFQRLLFTWIAKRRAKRVAHDYQAIGGKSPIFEDTEAIASLVRTRIEGPVLTFHRYLPSTHPQFLEEIEQLREWEWIRVFPLFPQFSYTTIGSIARWFSDNLCAEMERKLRWIKSYPADPAFVSSFQATIRQCLEEHRLREEETLLLFSAHGLPQRYICTGDPYQEECEKSYFLIARAFPHAAHVLCYQSLFGKEEWLKPYTVTFCQTLDRETHPYRNVVVVPLSFTSDHIETLFEIEQQYLPILREKGYNAIRCPALNLRPDWIEGIVHIMERSDLLRNAMLVRHTPTTCRTCYRGKCSQQVSTRDPLCYGR